MADETEKPPAPVAAPSDALPSWVWRAGAGGLLAIGWLFILLANKFNVTAPVVFVCLGYFAGVAAVYTLFRTGAATVAASEDDDPDSWGRPIGARGELEREKRTLLKAIKEAEFDLEMGKLSQADADAMIATYRAQAIAVIKELERADAGSGAGTTREKIEREVRARLELAKGKKAGKKGAKAVEPAAEPAAKSVEPADEPAAEAAPTIEDAPEARSGATPRASEEIRP